MSDPLYVNEHVEIPGAELIVRTSRSSGAGGQHANTTDSRVEVGFDIAGSPSLPEWARSRLLERLGPRVSAVAQDERSQLRNREIARSRLAERLRAALDRPSPRRPTRPGRASRERRLESKRRQSQRKQERRAPGEE
jgi:ribosome-associated protein